MLPRERAASPRRAIARAPRRAARRRTRDSATPLLVADPPTALAVTAEGASCAARAVLSEGMQTTRIARCVPADRFPDGVPKRRWRWWQRLASCHISAAFLTPRQNDNSKALWRVGFDTSACGLWCEPDASADPFCTAPAETCSRDINLSTLMTSARRSPGFRRWVRALHRVVERSQASVCIDAH